MTVPTVVNSYSEFYRHDLIKLDGIQWCEAYATKEDWDYHNFNIPTPVPTMINRAGKKQLVYLQPIKLGHGAFNYNLKEAEEVLSFPNGKKIAVFEKRTQPPYSNSVADITIYWFNFDVDTGKFISFWTGSCWRSDAGIYERMLADLKEKYSEVVAV